MITKERLIELFTASMAANRDFENIKMINTPEDARGRVKLDLLYARAEVAIAIASDAYRTALAKYLAENDPRDANSLTD